MKIDNPYFYLASSQLFPVKITTKSTEFDKDNSLLFELAKARDYALDGKHGLALSIYNELIKEFVNFPFLYACRSLLKSIIGEEEGAFYDYQVAKRLDFNYHNVIEWINNSGEMLESPELLELLEHEQTDEQYFINRATLYVQHFEYEKAVQDFTKAYELGNNPAVLISRGAVNMRMVRYDCALADFNLALSKQENLVQALVYRAKLYAAIKELVLADLDFNKAIQLSNGDASIYEERADFYEKTEQFELAVADYAVVIESNPDDFYAYVLRADLYEKLNMLKEALQDYDKAIGLNPYYSDLYQYRGDIRNALGDVKGAEEDYAKFEELEDE